MSTKLQDINNQIAQSASHIIPQLVIEFEILNRKDTVYKRGRAFHHKLAYCGNCENNGKPETITSYAVRTMFVALFKDNAEASKATSFFASRCVVVSSYRAAWNCVKMRWLCDAIYWIVSVCLCKPRQCVIHKPFNYVCLLYTKAANRLCPRCLSSLVRRGWLNFWRILFGEQRNNDALPGNDEISLLLYPSHTNLLLPWMYFGVT